MTETQPKSPARLLAEAEDLLDRHFPGDCWPDVLLPSEIMILMAGGFEGVHRDDFRLWRRWISGAIDAQALVCRREPAPADSGAAAESLMRLLNPPALMRLLNPLPPMPVSLGGRPGSGEPDLFIDRASFAAWLRGIGEDPSEHVRAWLGDAWEKKAAKVGASYATERWTTIARELGEAWMHEQERETGKRPTVWQIAEYLEGELSTRDICGAHGKWLSAATIKREALKGITGRKPGDNLR